jgi:uncharacterized protein (DUF1800 family)
MFARAGSGRWFSSLAAFGWLLVLFSSAAAGPEPRALGDREAAIHALNRLSFGPAPGQVDAVLKTGWRAWAEEQLRPEALDDRLVAKYLAEEYPSLAMDLRRLHETYLLPHKRARSPAEERKLNEMRFSLQTKLKKELGEAVLLRAVYSQRQFQEVIVAFWRDHLNVDANKVPYLATHYEEHVLRKHAFGKFEDLLLASAKHPAMLVYLDNHVSTAQGLNENYARELMELHTLGVDNSYTQQDVIELARVLTGWTFVTPTAGAPVAESHYGFRFNESAHAAVPATVVGLRLDGKGGMLDGERAIRHLAHHPCTAHFLATKLCRYLVHDAPPRELVERVAGVFRRTGGDLPAVYRAIVFSPEFTDSRNYQAKFKTPFEYVVSALRVTGAEIAYGRVLLAELRRMGQPVYECSLPTGYADHAEAWLDPGVLVFRWQLAFHLADGTLKGVEVPSTFWEPLKDLAPREQARKVLDAVLPGVSDLQTEQAVARAEDVPTMLALALGSPGFQQQ